MPNKDKTGPIGEGPMTGRGAGMCGGGAGRGFGRGHGPGRAMCAWADRQYQAMPKEERKAILEEEIMNLQQDLDSAKNELSNLEK